MVRLLRPFGSQRAALVAGLAYLAMALAYNDLALGRWGALVAYAGTPWVLGRLFRATGTAPFVDSAPGTVAAVGSPGTKQSVHRRVSDWSDRHQAARRVMALGLLEAVLVSFVPAAAVVVVLVALALVLSSVIYRDWRSTAQALTLALGATVVAALICLPWLIGVLSAGRGAVAVFGVPVPGSAGSSWGSLLRFAVGPIGASPLAWGFAVAAVVPLVLARGERFRWAGRLWSVALLCWLVAWAIGRGWTGSLAVDPHILLAPAAAAVAGAIGLGVVAFEEDLRAAEFGWRQLVTVVATGAVVLGAVPTLVSALPGRWDLPATDFSQSVAWMRAKSSSGAFRVLWLGDTRALTQGAWAAGDGLAYATSEGGSPDARWLWSAPGPGPADGLSAAVDQARAGRTDQLGRLLAPSGVRYVVLVTSLAPEIPGEQTPEQYPGAGRSGSGPGPPARPQLRSVGERYHRLRERRLGPAAGRGRRRVVGGRAGIGSAAGAGEPGGIERPARGAARPARAPRLVLLPGPPHPRHRPLGLGAGRSVGADGRLRFRRGVFARLRLGRAVSRETGGNGSPRFRRRADRAAVAAGLDRGVAGGDRPPGRRRDRSSAADDAAPASGPGGGHLRRRATGRHRAAGGGVRGRGTVGRGAAPVMTTSEEPVDAPGLDHRTTSGRHDRAPRHAALRPERGRWMGIIAAATLVALVALVDTAVAFSPAPAAPGASDALPVAPAGSYSSSAFCAGGTGTAAATTVYLTNSTDRTVSGVMTAVGPVGSGGAVPTTHRALSVPPLGSAAVNPADGLPGGSNASVFTFAGGGVSASQVVSGPGGWSTAPCASRTSPDWAFAGGSTASGNVLTLSLLNPAATESVVNVSFLTDVGVITPQAYQGLTVPPGQIVTENVGDFVQNANDIATLVTAQSGALVSTEFQQWSPGGTGGLSLRLGSPTPATTWRFAQTTAVPGSTVSFYVANPGSGPAAATISFGLTSGSVEPQHMVVAARSIAVFTASATAGLPHQVPYAVTVDSSQPVVVGRSVLAPGGSTSPVWGSSPATVTTTDQWLVPGPGVSNAPGTAGATVDSLAVANPGPSAVTVEVARLGEHHPFSTFKVAADGVTVLGASQVGGLATYVVSSSGPVDVEEDSGPSGAPGVVASSGFPILG